MRGNRNNIIDELVKVRNGVNESFISKSVIDGGKYDDLVKKKLDGMSEDVKHFTNACTKTIDPYSQYMKHSVSLKRNVRTGEPYASIVVSTLLSKPHILKKNNPCERMLEAIKNNFNNYSTLSSAFKMPDSITISDNGLIFDLSSIDGAEKFLKAIGIDYSEVLTNSIDVKNKKGTVTGEVDSIMIDVRKWLKSAGVEKDNIKEKSNKGGRSGYNYSLEIKGDYADDALVIFKKYLGNTACEVEKDGFSVKVGSNFVDMRASYSNKNDITTIVVGCYGPYIDL